MAPTYLNVGVVRVRLSWWGCSSEYKALIMRRDVTMPGIRSWLIFLHGSNVTWLGVGFPQQRVLLSRRERVD